jgi:hypothetical protein
VEPNVRTDKENEMNEPCHSAREVSGRKSLWLQTGLLAAASLLTVLPAVGAAEPREQHGSAVGETSHSLNLVAALEASRGAAYSLGSPGVLIDFGPSDTDIPEDPPQTLFLANILSGTKPQLSGPLDQDSVMPGFFLWQQPDGGLSKNRWGIRWRLSLVESGDSDGQL